MPWASSLLPLPPAFSENSSSKWRGNNPTREGGAGWGRRRERVLTQLEVSKGPAQLDRVAPQVVLIVKVTQGSPCYLLMSPLSPQNSPPLETRMVRMRLRVALPLARALRRAG